MSSPGELGTRAWRQLRQAILERDGGVCQIRLPGCTTWATEVDHIEPRAEGGAVWDELNLRGACRNCNGRRAAEATNRRRRRGGAFNYRTPLPPTETRF